MSTTYAASTSVSVDKSRAEIEHLLRRFGADSFASGWDESKAMIGFTMGGRQIRFTMAMPNHKDSAFTRTETGRPRTQAAADTAYDQAVRSRWRSLALVIKAKLEAVNSGIVTFEDEWGTHVVLPDGSTVRDRLFPYIDQAYATGTVPPMLALGST